MDIKKDLPSQTGLLYVCCSILPPISEEFDRFEPFYLKKKISFFELTKTDGFLQFQVTASHLRDMLIDR